MFQSTIPESIPKVTREVKCESSSRANTPRSVPSSKRSKAVSAGAGDLASRWTPEGEQLGRAILALTDMWFEGDHSSGMTRQAIHQTETMGYRVTLETILNASVAPRQKSLTDVNRAMHS